MDAWTVRPGSSVDLSSIDPDSTPNVRGDRESTKTAEIALRKKLGHVQLEEMDPRYPDPKLVG
jgi:hypothetical protein